MRACALSVVLNFDADVAGASAGRPLPAARAVGVARFGRFEKHNLQTLQRFAGAEDPAAWEGLKMWRGAKSRFANTTALPHTVGA